MSKKVIRVVFSGGPGSGKSTALELLRERGYPVVEEAGRKIIRDECSEGGQALPWEDKDAFAAKMLQHAVESYPVDEAETQPTFFDRGVVDVLGYCDLEALEQSEDLKSAVTRLPYDRVFLFPPWREIYCGDAERKQDFLEAERTFQAMYNAYMHLDYTIALVPKVGVEERVAWILDRCRVHD